LHKADRQISDVYVWVVDVHNKNIKYSIDLIQHVFVIICEQDKDFILDLASRGKLKAYVVRMLYNTNRWSKSNYAKEQATNEIPTESFADIPDEQFSEINIPLNKIYWYKAEVLKLYAEIGNYRGVAEKTGIPTASIFQTVKQAKNEIKRLL